LRRERTRRYQRSLFDRRADARLPRVKR
jgi:hypothetical protein